MNPEQKAADLFFRRFANHVNCVTPTVLARTLLAPHVAAELSCGQRSGRTIYGVTVVIEGQDGRVYSAGTSPDEPLRSDVFTTRDAAEARIKQLGKLARGH
jgi:hypothetical protein